MGWCTGHFKEYNIVISLESLAYSFLFGLISGTLIAGVYNLLVLKRLNLFGLESGRD